MVRAPCCDKVGLKKGPWSADEDQILVAYVTTYGHGNWRALPKHAGLLRCGKSCRLRWTNYLRPDIKRGNFSKEEEEMLVSLHEKLGNRWSAIAARLPGRTDNEIKNVWHTHIKKRLIKQQKINDHALDERCKPNYIVSSKGARGVANSPMSPECRSGITSSSGTDFSSVDASMVSMASSQDVFDIDESFWSEALSMDHNSNVPIDVPMSATTMINEPLRAAGNLAKEGGDGDDSMNFWLSILMEAGDF